MNRTPELQAALDEADSEEFSSLEDAAVNELMRLWDELYWAIRDAHNGCWSTGCESTAYRIAALTRALGKPTPWQQIQPELLRTGIYQTMHDLMGMPYEKPETTVETSEAV